jgi:hypothetical protein
MRLGLLAARLGGDEFNGCSDDEMMRNELYVVRETAKNCDGVGDKGPRNKIENENKMMKQQDSSMEGPTNLVGYKRTARMMSGNDDESVPVQRINIRSTGDLGMSTFRRLLFLVHTMQCGSTR